MNAESFALWFLAHPDASEAQLREKMAQLSPQERERLRRCVTADFWPRFWSSDVGRAIDDSYK